MTRNCWVEIAGNVIRFRSFQPVWWAGDFDWVYLPLPVSVQVLQLVTDRRFNSSVVIIEINPDIANRLNLTKIDRLGSNALRRCGGRRLRIFPHRVPNRKPDRGTRSQSSRSSLRYISGPHAPLANDSSKRFRLFDPELARRVKLSLGLRKSLRRKT
jgi:hypothetical protein